MLRAPRVSFRLFHALLATVYREIGLRDLLHKLGANEIASVLIEGGGNVLSQALDECLIDKLQIYVAPIFASGPVPAFAGRGAARTSEAPRLERVTFEKIGTDLCISGYPKYAATATA